jgi:tripartite-type tricarboxylate transporter receptor subunit TctC
MRHVVRASVLAGAAAGLLVTMWSPAEAQDDFYKGKTISIVIGARTGSLAVAAQIVGRHLGQHIPGNPTVVNRQMPGGAHLNATNYIFNVAEADGLTILAANPNVAMGQLAKLPNVRFDASKFIWLGSSGPDGSMFSIRASLPYKTFQEMRDSGREYIAGTTGPGSNAHDMPLLLKEFAGLKLRLVAGYAANSDILLAVERKEADAYSALATTIQLAVDRGAVRPLVRSRTPVPGWNHLPTDESLATNDTGRALMAIRGIPQSIGRAFAVRPGTPPERVAMLRQALAKTIKDPAFLADAEKAKINMEYISADQVSKWFGDLLNQPPHVLEAMNKYLKVGE